MEKIASDDGETALIRAAKDGDTKAIWELLEAGADIEVHGLTALMWAAINGHTKVIQALLKAGADIEETEDNKGWTPLMRVAADGNTKAILALLEAGADIEARDRYGGTALMKAVKKGHTKAIRVLVEAGADIETRHNGGWTAFDLWKEREENERKNQVALMSAFGLGEEKGKRQEISNLLRPTSLRGDKTNIDKSYIKVDDSNAHRVSFSTEAELENFLCSHWENTVFGKGFDIYKDTEGRSGKQYPTDLEERIDILAISKDRKTFLVVELKVSKAPDTVVAQCQRYIGFVKEKLAKKGQTARGVIIATEKDKKVERSLSEVSNIDFCTYKIDYGAVHLEKIE
ncbi:MAG: endonuclease NucS [Candidatus Dadabacteria bacterium]|nr:endonuclease NucS [Candidatus Dadabacteria bacterium]